MLERETDDIARAAHATLLTDSSIEKALDLEWSDPEQKNSAIVTLVEQLDNLQAWIAQNLSRQSRSTSAL
jgi:hypothetical protein